MPQVDGFEVLRELRAKNTVSGTPFIFLTALGAREEKMHAHEHGCDAYLTKPVDFAVLDAMLKSHVERQRVVQRAFSRRQNSFRSHMIAAIEDALHSTVGGIHHQLDTMMGTLILQIGAREQFTGAPFTGSMLVDDLLAR